MAEMTPWQHFEEEDYFKAGFEPGTLEPFRDLFNKMTEMKGVKAGVMVNHLNVAFADSAVAPVKTENDFKIMIRAFIDLNDEDSHSPR